MLLGILAVVSRSHPVMTPEREHPMALLRANRQNPLQAVFRTN